MKHIILFVVFLGSLSDALSQSIAGQSPVTQNTSWVYTYQDDAVYSSYQWEVVNGNVTSFSRSGITYSATILWTVAGTGTINFKVGANVLATRSVTIDCVAPANPGVTLTSSSNFCGDKVISYSGAPPANVTWFWQTSVTGTATLNSATSYNAVTTGTYYLRAKANGGNCWSRGASSLAVTVNANPDAPNSPSVSSNLCDTKILSKNGTAANGVSWYWQGTNSMGVDNSSVVATSPTYSVATEGMTTHYLRAQNANGCWSSPVASIVTVTKTPSPPVVANGSGRFGPGPITVSVAPVTGVSQYEWTVNGGLVSGVTSSSYTNPNLTATQIYSVSSVNGVCKSSALTVTATFEPLPVINGTNQGHKVMGEPVVLSAGGIYQSYQWKNAGGQVVGTGPTLTTSTLGSYSLTVTKANITGTAQADFSVRDQLSGQNENFVVANTLLIGTVNDTSSISDLSVDKRSQSVQYFDGLGRPVQTVVTQGSPAKQDIVQPIVYDKYGRESRQYLPVVPATTTGWYKPGIVGADGNLAGVAQNFYANGTSDFIVDDPRPFSETEFEKSPLNRPVKSYSPGQAWATKPVEQRYSINLFNSGTSSMGEKVIGWKVVSDAPVRQVPMSGFVETGGYYSTGNLFVTTVVDEHGNSVREYKDKTGRVVLKKVQALSNASNLNDTLAWSLTYYVYDDLGNLRFVLPPELSQKIHRFDATSYNPTTTDLNLWAFQYKYDQRNRMIEKRVPGAEPVYMVYDKRDRLVLTQDGNQRSATTDYWTFTKYDELNRPIATGIKDTTDGATRAQMQVAVDVFYNKPTATISERFVGYSSANIHGYSNRSYPVVTNGSVESATSYLTVTYYDTYDYRSNWGTSFDYLNEGLSETSQGIAYSFPTTAFMRVTGQVTGTKVKVLDGGVVGGNNYLRTVNYYDENYRPVQSITEKYRGGVDRISSLYDFTGKVLRTRTTHGTHVINRRFVYDHASRLLETWHKVGTGSDILLSRNEYNALGQLIDKRLHSTVAGGTNARQSVDYRYNIRGWLTSINNPTLTNDGGVSNNDTGDLFGMNLYYNQVNSSLANQAAFNGNISAIQWSNNMGLTAESQKAYSFTYDPMNRISSTTFRNNATGWAVQSNNRFSETGYQYDLNGNILTLKRNDSRASGIMDSLSYYYGNFGNQLQAVTDGGDKNKGFVDLNTSLQDYRYDANGNMINDLNKGIGDNINDNVNRIQYNFLNLPEFITKRNASLRYIYDATGRKLAQVANYGSSSVTTDYVGEFVYEDNRLQFINHEEGRIVMSAVQTTAMYNGENTNNVTASNVTLSNVTQNGTEKYLRAASSGTTVRSGVNRIGGTQAVVGGEVYKIRVKGYTSGANPAFLNIRTNSTDLDWLNVRLPNNEKTEIWVERTITIPAGHTSMEVNVQWNTVNATDVMFINEFEIIKQQTKSPEYQYYYKDHLGNIRLVFTTIHEQEIANAGYETSNLSAETSKFQRMENARRVNSSIFDRTNGANAGFSQRLTGGTNEKYGIARTIKVMPGDTVKMEVFAKYVDRNQANWTSAFQTLMNSIAAANPAGGVVVDGPSYSTSTSSFPFPNQHNFADRTSGTAPRAFLNYISFDDNWNPILLDNTQTNFVRLTSTPMERGQDVAHERMAATFIVKQPGYVYIYLSNDETTPLEVFFDDFNVTHAKGPVVQSQDYYPFGLTFNSYNRENSASQGYKYNGKEEQDELSINWVDYGWRMYNPTVARWSAVDNLAEKYIVMSPYHYAGNNPVKNIDVDGNKFTESGKKWAKKLWGEISNRISANNEKMGKKMAALESGYDKKGKALSTRKAERYQRQIGRLQENNRALTSVADEIVALDNSSQVYNVVESSSLNESGPVQGTGNAVAATSFNFSTGAVDITVSPNAGIALFAHEMKHAYQFDIGEISLGSLGGLGYSFILDKHDEVSGYQRQALFGSRESGARGIGSLPNRYQTLPTGPVDVNEYTYQGRLISQMNDYERNHLSKIMKQAYRLNGTTYQGR